MFFKDWLDILFYKKKPAELAGTSLGEGLKNVAIAGLILGLLSGIFQYLSPSKVANVLSIPGPAAIIVSIISGVIMAVIGALIGGAILHVFCKIVGGKGSIGNYIGALAKIYAAIAGTALAVILLIEIIAVLALGTNAIALLAVLGILGLIGLIVSLWELVLVVLATNAVQQLSTGRTIVAVIIIPIIIGVILLFVIGMAILSLFMGSGALGGLNGTGGFLLG
ncbi:MAG: YIP1 family protein [Candidatus ainarchaeum sp.]|nr:YIP1 family protein [Candidatus ainarchaeum sp.]